MEFKKLQEANATIKTTEIKGKDYAQVNERIKVFRMLFPNGAIVTEILSNVEGVVTMKASAYDGDNLLATGHAYEEKTSSYINKTSYIENCETSAVGRALGMLGIGIDTSVCSAEELQNAINHQDNADVEDQKINSAKQNVFIKKCETDGIDMIAFLHAQDVEEVSDITEKQFTQWVQDKCWQKIKERYSCSVEERSGK